MTIFRPDLLRVALTDAKPSHLEAALTASVPELLKIALQEAREDTLRTALTEADIPLLAIAITRVNQWTKLLRREKNVNNFLGKT